MQFHEYTHSGRVAGKSAGPVIRATMAEFSQKILSQPYMGDRIVSEIAALEYSWGAHERPYYNVYPVAIDICRDIKLNMRWGDIVFPERHILLRFPVGHEPHGISCCLVTVPSEKDVRVPDETHKSNFPYVAIHQFGLYCFWHINGGNIHTASYAANDIKSLPVFDVLACQSEKDEQLSFLIRLMAFIGLLSAGNDLITPVILSADRREYDATCDESRKRWLERRASARAGRGFDVGRDLERQRSSSPHWRSPHLALFHTGPGRRTPVLKVRSGCAVVPKDLCNVPTGFLGAESEDEISDKDGQRVYLRQKSPVPNKRRYKIMRRDGFRCRICGVSSDDGAKLEVDHIIARARGGSNDDKNLWTLCFDCNNGKSDSPLSHTA